LPPGDNPIAVNKYINSLYVTLFDRFLLLFISSNTFRILQHRSNFLKGPARPRPTALLSPSSEGKPEAATAVVVAFDDGHKNARNMLSCI
jgi:hypothetical protein